MRLSDGLAWAASAIGDGAHVTSSRRLKGGLTSNVHAVNILDRTGTTHRLVLRRWDHDKGWEIRTQTEREARTLTALAPTDIPAPELVAVDVPNGALLMTRLDGRARFVHTKTSIEEMAQLLVRIHETDLNGEKFETWIDPQKLVAPSDAKRPDVWRAAIEIARSNEPPIEDYFIHRDYQHFNMLWSRERLTGMLDWTFPCRGPRDVDVGHCRLNLAILCSPDVADGFLHAYESASGRSVNPLWDVLEIVKYSEPWKHFIPQQVAGRVPVDTEGMTSRVEETLDRALARL